MIFAANLPLRKSFPLILSEPYADFDTEKKPTDSIECWTAVRWATVDVVEKPPPPILGFPNCHWLGNEKFTCLLVWLHWRTTTCTSCHTQDTNICIRTASGSCKGNLFSALSTMCFAYGFFWNVSGPMPVVTFFFGLPIPAFHITRASMGETITINDGPTLGHGWTHKFPSPATAQRLKPGKWATGAANPNVTGTKIDRSPGEPTAGALLQSPI